MGLKTKQSSSNDHQQSEPLKCPRCSSTNTKFCYYNNYNKSQPRHFCKSCKRHWTKGGILRTVPVGGGRKNKRPAATSTAAAARARQDYHFSTTGLYNVSAPLNPSTQSPVFSSSSNFGMNVSVVNPASYQSLNDDRIDDHYYPKSSDSMEESSTITSTVNIPSSISSGSWPDPGSMGWPEYWHWNEIDDHVLAGLDCLSTSWADVLAEISNPKN